MTREAARKQPVEINEAAPGRLVVKGELTFATARHARELGVLMLEGTRENPIVVDCAGVTRGDSAGLAVLLDWLAWGRRRSRAVSLQNLPAPLVAIARISEVDELLTATG